MISTTPRKIEFADTLRGVACLSVVATHLVLTFAAFPRVVWNLTGIEFAPEPAKPILWFFRQCPVNFGAFGVSLFIIISGFVIPISITRLDRTPFAVARLFRIVPTYAVALAFTIAGIWTLRTAFGVPYEIPWEAALAHVAFVRDIVWAPSIDGVAWTLEVEMKFYLICIIFAPLLIKSDTDGLLIFSAILTAIVLWLGPIPANLGDQHLRLNAMLKTLYVTALFLNFMWIGAVLAFHWHGRCSTTRAAIATFSLNAMFWAQMYATGQVHSWNAFRGFVTYDGAVALFLLAYLRPTWFSGWKTLSFFAKISYPLYLVHGVVGYGIEQLLCSFGVDLYVSIAIATTLMIGVATVLHRFVEMPTHELGRALARPSSRLAPPGGSRETDRRSIDCADTHRSVISQSSCQTYVRVQLQRDEPRRGGSHKMRNDRFPPTRVHS